MGVNLAASHPPCSSREDVLSLRQAWLWRPPRVGPRVPRPSGGPGIWKEPWSACPGQQRGFKGFCLERPALCHSGAWTPWQLERHLLPAPSPGWEQPGPLAGPAGSQGLGLGLGLGPLVPEPQSPSSSSQSPCICCPARTAEASDRPVVPWLEGKHTALGRESFPGPGLPPERAEVRHN